MNVQTHAPVTPSRVMDLTFQFVASRALAAGVHLDLFTHVHQGATTVDTLAERTSCSPRGVRVLTDALCALGLLEKTQDGLRNAPDSEMFLVSTSQGYLGPLITHEDPVWDQWLHLQDAVRSGTSRGRAVEGPLDEGEFFSGFVGALFNLNFMAAKAVAERHGESVREILDIGPGSGVWSIAFAMARPEAKATAIDYDTVLQKVTKPYVERFGLADRYTMVAGNFREVDFGEGRYDVALLGHILHSEGEARSIELLRRLRRALRPGGKVIVAEMIPDEKRAEDRFALLFGLNMLLFTEQGEVFTASQLERMGREAGFSAAEWMQAPAPYPLLVLTR